jgi:hypothetical protein
MEEAFFQPCSVRGNPPSFSNVELYRQLFIGNHPAGIQAAWEVAMIRLTFHKAKVLGMALGVLIALGGTTRARAEDGSSCERKIEHQQRDLDKTIARHGYYSRQANHEQRELDRTYDRCGRRDRDRDRDGYRDHYHYRD